MRVIGLSSCPFPLFSRLYVQWRFRAGVEKQFMALQKGFHELIPPHLLKMFDEKELELLISGLGKVDVEDWKANSRLKHCTPETSVIQWFWKVWGGGEREGDGEEGRGREKGKRGEGGRRGGGEREREGEEERGREEGRREGRDRVQDLITEQSH